MVAGADSVFLLADNFCGERFRLPMQINEIDLARVRGGAGEIRVSRFVGVFSAGVGEQVVRRLGKSDYN